MIKNFGLRGFFRVLSITHDYIEIHQIVAVIFSSGSKAVEYAVKKKILPVFAPLQTEGQYPAFVEPAI